MLTTDPERYNAKLELYNWYFQIIYVKNKLCLLFVLIRYVDYNIILKSLHIFIYYKTMSATMQQNQWSITSKLQSHIRELIIVSLYAPLHVWKYLATFIMSILECLWLKYLTRTINNVIFTCTYEEKHSSIDNFRYTRSHYSDRAAGRLRSPSARIA